jgi:4-diphosphocytidyl-2-C-methyl-D-erythritol kinase
VLRAARALAGAAKVDMGMAAGLTKNIPAAAGLGGGSADAAAALRGLMRLWDIPPDAVDLPAIALELGADIPVCLAARPSFVGGVGEKIEAAPALPAAGLLLVNPGVALATPSVFTGRRGGFLPPGRFDESPASAVALAAMLRERENDLTGAAISLAPVISNVLDALESVPGCHLARMTGSGATCFGLFDDESAAASAAGEIMRDGWWVEATRILQPGQNS